MKCDLGRPCRTCVEREHPELCDYHPPNKRHETDAAAALTTATAAATTNGLTTPLADKQTVTLSQNDFNLLCRKLDSVEKALDDLRREVGNSSSSNGNGLAAHRAPAALSGRSSPYPLVGFPPESGNGNGNGNSNNPATRFDNSFMRHTSVHGIHTKNELTGQTVHLGPASVPALVMTLGQGNREQPDVQELLGKSILPIFGLDNESATYPFVDLWGLPHGSLAKAEELARAIPSDSQCLNFFRYYRDMGHIIYPGVADTATFESDLTMFLMVRAGQISVEDETGATNGVSEQSIHSKSLQWIGLLFAVLASGCQCSGLPRKERELTSQVYGR